jgi:hypothetical protein
MLYADSAHNLDRRRRGGEGFGSDLMSNAWPTLPSAHRWRGAAEPWSLVARVGLLVVIALLIGFGARAWIGATVL